MGVAFLGPSTDERHARIFPARKLMQLAMRLIGMKGIGRLRMSQSLSRSALPLYRLTSDLVQLGGPCVRHDAAEGGTRFDRLQLFGIAHQNNLGMCLCGGVEDVSELLR